MTQSIALGAMLPRFNRQFGQEGRERREERGERRGDEVMDEGQRGYW